MKNQGIRGTFFKVFSLVSIFFREKSPDRLAEVLIKEIKNQFFGNKLVSSSNTIFLFIS